VNYPKGVFQDSAGQEHEVSDVTFQPNGSRGTYRAPHQANHVNGRGHLRLPGRAPVQIEIQAVEPADHRGVNLYRFMIS
jgi:hypothetical protein